MNGNRLVTFESVHPATRLGAAPTARPARTAGR